MFKFLKGFIWLILVFFACKECIQYIILDNYQPQSITLLYGSLFVARAKQFLYWFFFTHKACPKQKLPEKMTPLLKKDSSIGRRFNLISKRTISQSIVCIFSLENQQKRKCGRCSLLHPNHSNGKYQFAT